jgi:hypothetical protein
MTSASKKSPRFDSILIVTYGRSGSTLLQGVLNALPSVLIRGENYNFCWGIYQAWKSICVAKLKFGDSNKTKMKSSSWYGAELLSPSNFQEMARELIKVQLGIPSDSDMVWGFKEIRYIDFLDELPNFLNFMKILFPGVAIIFNTRELPAVLESGWWYSKNKDETTNLLRKADRVFFEYAEKNNNAFVQRYERTILGEPGLRPLFEFLSMWPDIEEISNVLQTRHSYEVKETTISQSIKNRHDKASKNYADSKEDLRALAHIKSAELNLCDEKHILISTIRDEIQRLPWFLEHYRALGTKEFFIIDNGSTDGSTEFLKEQDDVTLYSAPKGQYNSSGFGTVWTDALSYKHGINRWALVADVDELLVWPNCFTEKIPGLVKKAERLGLNRVFTPMVDVYGKTPCSEMPPYEVGKPFSVWCNLMDHVSLMKYGFHNGRFSLFGGPRMRFGKSGESPPIMSKQKLYFVEQNGFRSINPHFDNYVLPSPLVAPLLHYKFMPDFKYKIDKAIYEGQHWKNAREYKNYKEAELYKRIIVGAMSVPVDSPDGLSAFIEQISATIRAAGVSGSIHWRRFDN